MSKRLIATLLVISSIAATCGAVGVCFGENEGIVAQQAQEEHYFLNTYEIEEDTEVNTVVETGATETIEEVEPIIITTGSGYMDGSSFTVDTYDTYSLPGSFEINPYAGRLRGEPVSIVNTGDTDMVIIAESCVRANSRSPKVVKQSTFSDWTNLGVEDTANNIALGLMVKSRSGKELTTFWFNSEGSQRSQDIYTLSPGEKVTIEIIGKHGMSWPKSQTIAYKCIIGFEVIPLEIIPEPPEVIETTEGNVISEFIEGIEDVAAPEAPAAPKAPKVTEENIISEIIKDIMDVEAPSQEEPEASKVVEVTKATETPEVTEEQTVTEETPSLDIKENKIEDSYTTSDDNISTIQEE